MRCAATPRASDSSNSSSSSGLRGIHSSWKRASGRSLTRGCSRGGEESTTSPGPWRAYRYPQRSRRSSRPGLTGCRPRRSAYSRKPPWLVKTSGRPASGRQSAHGGRGARAPGPHPSEFPIAGPPMADAPRPVRAALGAERLRLVVVEELAVNTTLDPHLSLRALAHYSGCSVRWLRDRLADPHRPPTTGPMERCSSAGATGITGSRTTVRWAGRTRRGSGRGRGARGSRPVAGDNWFRLSSID
jgi:hypothetical protein